MPDQCLCLYPEGVVFRSPGSPGFAGAPWENFTSPVGLRFPGCARSLASLDCGIEPLRGKNQIVRLSPGWASRPWAVESNPFGVKTKSCDCPQGGLRDPGLWNRTPSG